MQNRFVSSLIIGCTLLCTGSKAEEVYDVIDLGTSLNQTMFGFGGGKAVNNLGQVVISGTDPEGGFLWEDGTFTLLKGFSPVALNDTGQILGTYGPSPFSFPAILTKVGDEWLSQNLPTLGGNGHPQDISDAGLAVGHSWTEIQNSGDIHAVMWKDGVLTDLHEAIPGLASNYDGSRSYGLNNRNQVLIDYGPGGYIWDQGFVTEVAGLDSLRDINDSGHVVGGVSVEAAMVQDGQVTMLGTVLLFSATRAINDNGQIVGWSSNIVWFDDLAVIWQDGQITDLNSLISPDSGWHLRRALDINDGGWIVGFGTAPDGLIHGFLLVPSTFVSGDTNGDGLVDLIEVAAFQNCFGADAPTGTCKALDLSADDTIDLLDLSEVLFRLTGP